MAGGAGGAGQANDATVVIGGPSLTGGPNPGQRATDQELLDLRAAQAEDHAGRLVAKVAKMSDQLAEARSALAEAKTAAKAARKAASENSED